MSAPTGIAVSDELATVFSVVVNSQDARFLKISIKNESLVPDGTFPPSGTLEEDLNNLKDILEDNVPAYVLVRLDDPPSEWLAVFYVPDSAKVRDKMLYAATRHSLTKSLGATHFTDSIFATTRDDLTAEAYTKHKRHLAAPKPMSAREMEMEHIKAAEREAGGLSYDGSRTRLNHVGQGVGLKWSPEAEEAITELGTRDDNRLVIFSIDPATETLVLSSSVEVDVSHLARSLPSSDPCYAFFGWSQHITSPPHRVIVPIYSCPSASPVRHRMLYSSAVLTVVKQVKDLLASAGTTSILTSRKIETSNPTELDEKYLVTELGFTNADSLTGATTPTPTEGSDKKPFARPKGPGRKR